jgi:hypothetical protein
MSDQIRSGSEQGNSEALAVAVRALKWYASPSHWSSDDWGIRAVIAPPDYSHAHPGGEKARRALNRIERMGSRS